MELQRTPLLERSALESTYSVESVHWAQLGAGAFEMRYGVIDAAPIELSVRSFNLGFMVEADLAPQRFLVGLLADPRTPTRWFGMEVDKDYIGATRSDIHVSAAGPGALYQISIDRPSLERQFPAAPDVLALMENVDGVMLSRNPMLAPRIRATLHRVFSMNASIRRRALPHGMPIKMLHGTLLPLLASALESFDEHSVERSKCLTRRLSAVRKCQEYMREHVDATLTLLDLSQVSGMRSRSLINAFEAVTGFSPMDYLKRLRLNGVHRTLQRADRSRTRIIDIATEWGFWHMGHFTADYRAMFGQTPSGTLMTR